MDRVCDTLLCTRATCGGSCVNSTFGEITENHAQQHFQGTLLGS